MFMQKFWIPIGISLLAVMGCGLFNGRQIAKQEPIKVNKLGEVEESAMREILTTSPEGTYEMAEVFGKMLPVPRPDDPTLSSGLQEAFDNPYFNRDTTLAWLWQQEKEGRHIETNAEVATRVSGEWYVMETQGYYYHVDGKWYEYPTDGSHWSSNHLPENPEEYYADDPEALQLWHAVQVMLKYKESGLLDDPDFVPAAYPDYVEAATVRGEITWNWQNYSSERRLFLAPIRYQLLDKP